MKLATLLLPAFTLFIFAPLIAQADDLTAKIKACNSNDHLGGRETPMLCSDANGTLIAAKFTNNFAVISAEQKVTCYSLQVSNEPDQENQYNRYASLDHGGASIDMIYHQKYDEQNGIAGTLTLNGRAPIPMSCRY